MVVARLALHPKAVAEPGERIGRTTGVLVDRDLESLGAAIRDDRQRDEAIERAHQRALAAVVHLPAAGSCEREPAGAVYPPLEVVRELAEMVDRLLRRRGRRGLGLRPLVGIVAAG